MNIPIEREYKVVPRGANWNDQGWRCHHEGHQALMDCVEAGEVTAEYMGFLLSHHAVGMRPRHRWNEPADRGMPRSEVLVF